METFADCDVVELRRYVLHPGRFDDLRAVFERWFVDGQEAAGIRLGGRFRDRDHPDRFVWLRGFTSMVRRREALETFYTGPIWRAHRDAANATMIDTDDVLLLRPTVPAHRPVDGAGWAIGQAWSIPDGSDLAAELAGAGHRVLEGALGRPVATWRTEPSPNTFEALPVRDGNYLVWLAVFPDEAEWSAVLSRPEWRRITDPLTAAGGTYESLRLEPSLR